MQEYIQPENAQLQAQTVSQQDPSTSVRAPAVPEVNVTIPGLDKMASGLSSLNQGISALPQKFREEALQLVSSVEGRWQVTQTAHNVGFFNGCVATLALTLILYFVFASRKKNA